VSTEPTVTEADLQAYADGRLGVERRAEVEAWLAARPRRRSASRLLPSRRGIARGLRSGARRAGSATSRKYGDTSPACSQDAPSPAGSRLARCSVRSQAGRRATGAGLPGRRLPRCGDGAPRRIAHATIARSAPPVEVAPIRKSISWPGSPSASAPGARAEARRGRDGAGRRAASAGRERPGGLVHVSDRCRTSLTLYIRAEAKGNRETAFRYARENNVSVFYWIERDCG